MLGKSSFPRYLSVSLSTITMPIGAWLKTVRSIASLLFSLNSESVSFFKAEYIKKYKRIAVEITYKMPLVILTSITSYRPGISLSVSISEKIIQSEPTRR